MMQKIKMNKSDYDAGRKKIPKSYNDGLAK